MPRDFEFFLEDMLEAIEKVQTYTRGMSFSDFEKNDLVVDAVVRNLEVIGEASKRIPEDVKRRAPEVEWRKVGAFRDVLAHEYFRVNRRIVWDVVEKKLPALASACEKLLRGG